MTTPVEPRPISAAEAAAYLALVQAQAQVRRTLTKAAIDAVLAPIGAFNSWWDGDDISRMIAGILKKVQPIQLEQARVTDAYIARTLTQLRGRPVRPVGAVDVTQLRRRLPANVLSELATGRRVPDVVEIGDTEDGPGTDIDRELDALVDDDETEWLDPAEPYGRLADMYRWDTIARGATPEAAKARVLARAESLIRTDLALVIREQEIKTMRSRGVQLYRRVLHPELADSGLSCGLCVVAADRLYTVEKFKRELHDRCNCESIPIENGKDPGAKLNQDDLESLYAAAGATIGRSKATGGGAKQKGALKRVRVAVTEHGELGPILVNQSGEFRTAADFARTQVPNRKIRAKAQLESLEKSLASLEARNAAGEDVRAPLEWQRNQVAKLRREVGR